ncbi:DUF1624 domain-containing protein [Microvirga soli]|uniref:DUF1624 domain-containing protein n=1 Tax=Microvirga soli TaxID=1854496 RepID=UPI00191DCDDF|nr:heparan-alpha-glucosaminide N-acetyltransferase [Microvirga soli]
MRHSDVKASSLLSQSIAVQRWDVIDVARGLAILAMIVYHFSWDLSFLQLIETNILQVPAWRWFARCIAGSFLMLSGLGLVLAHAKGFHGGAFLKRLLKVGGAALAVTIATYFAFPDSYIFFGILHCIAVSGVLALPFLRLHPIVTLAAGILCLVAPHLLTSPALDAPWLDWLGLGAADPVTNDYVPIFPWFGLVLLGVAAGRLLLARQETMSLAGWRSKGLSSRLLIWAGRKSLPIYLTHQIILLAILYGVLQIVGPNRMAEAQPFMIQCEATCLQNAQPQTCRTLCSCTVETLRQTDLWQKVLNNTTTPEDQTRISRAAQQCLRQSPPS